VVFWRKKNNVDGVDLLFDINRDVRKKRFLTLYRWDTRIYEKLEEKRLKTRLNVVGYDNNSTLLL